MTMDATAAGDDPLAQPTGTRVFGALARPAPAEGEGRGLVGGGAARAGVDRGVGRGGAAVRNFLMSPPYKRLT